MAQAGPEQEPEEAPAGEDAGEDLVAEQRSAGYFTASPGLLQVSLDTGDVGYMWGLSGGYMLRTQRVFAIGLGLGFEHGIIELGDVAPALQPADHQFRVQFEALPGISLLDDRLFAYIGLGIGYAAWLQRWTILIGDEIRATNYNGFAFSPSVGANLVIWRDLFVGASVGFDLQWFRLADASFDAHNFDAKVTLGWYF